ncbi:MAG: M20 family metallo-hydrolase [Bacteroidota bacterium]|nr:M20 family metallo-hydrolase [Bacteroidota bacterium]MDP4205807.1 M20 family metallo-hydrolase [Bacteroidota bacterium]
MELTILAQDAINLLEELISTPSLSRQEAEAATLIEHKWKEWGVEYKRQGNNLWAHNRFWQEGKPVILLNSHIDTVKPAEGWETDPFTPTYKDGKLHGLGSNDAGGCLVSLMAAFRYFYNQKDLPYNLIMAATAEEEVSGLNGVASILPQLEPVDLAIVGEPTRMQMAIAEKGLLVIDGAAHGKAGHAAREEGDNALYKAVDDIQCLRNFQFPLFSDLLGKVKLSVTQIEAGYQHNVVPDICRFVIDVRTNEFYSNEEAFNVITGLLQSECKARSFRLNSSHIPFDHPLVKRGQELGLSWFGSPTTSDQAIIRKTSMKIGPGDSARSHTANEYILPEEIQSGITTYIQLLENLKIK